MEISFFLSALFMWLNGRPLGRISDIRARPTVVSTRLVEGSNSPESLFLVHSVRRTLILAASSTWSGVQRALHFTDVGEDHAFALAVDALARCVVQTQHHVLRRNDGGLARCGEQHVVGGQHQRAGFHLCFHRQRNVDSHLVTVEVGVEGRADERVQLDGLAFDQEGLEGLDCPVGAAWEHGSA